MTETTAVSRFLAELERGLRGGRRWREETLAEIRCHLYDALEEASQDSDAERRIVQQFGDPAALARSLNGVEKGLRRIPRVVLCFACSALSAIAATAIVTRMADGPGNDGSSSPGATQLVGTLVVATPGAATVRILRDGGTYSLSK